MHAVHVHARPLPSRYRAQPRAATEKGRWSPRSTAANTAATLHIGDARDVLAAMPDGSADCIVTSPPYWAKRDYGVVGQYGHEPSPPPTSRPCEPSSARPAGCWPTMGHAGSTSGDSYSAGSATASGLHAYIGPAWPGGTRRG